MSDLVGPRGGDLGRERDYPEARNAHFQPLDGEMGLHRGKEWKDTAVAGRVNEKPWHRMAAVMMMGGHSNKEIAVAAGVTEVSVSQLVAQRWFQELLSSLSKQVSEPVIGVLQSQALASLAKMIEIRDSAESPRLQYAAAKDLLELAHGKAVQRTVSITSTTHYNSSKEELQSIEQQLEELRKRKSV